MNRLASSSEEIGRKIAWQYIFPDRILEMPPQCFSDCLHNNMPENGEMIGCDYVIPYVEQTTDRFSVTIGFILSALKSSKEQKSLKKTKRVTDFIAM